MRLASHEKSTTSLLVLAECFEVLGEMPTTTRADRHPGHDADPGGTEAARN